MRVTSQMTDITPGRVIRLRARVVEGLIAEQPLDAAVGLAATAVTVGTRVFRRAGA